MPTMNYFDARIGTISSVNPQSTGIDINYQEAEIEFEDKNGVISYEYPDFGIKLPIVAGENVAFEVDETNKVVKINATDTTDYTALENLPSINGVAVEGAKTSSDLLLGLQNNLGGFQAGDGAVSASEGAALGKGAQAASGGAIGSESFAGAGGAIGQGAKTNTGFAGGVGAISQYATDGTTPIAGAIAIGATAKAQAAHACQLGTGTNKTANTLQFRSYQLLNASGTIPAARLPVGTGLSVSLGALSAPQNDHRLITSRLLTLSADVDTPLGNFISSTALKNSDEFWVDIVFPYTTAPTTEETITLTFGSDYYTIDYYPTTDGSYILQKKSTTTSPYVFTRSTAGSIGGVARIKCIKAKHLSSDTSPLFFVQADFIDKDSRYSAYNANSKPFSNILLKSANDLTDKNIYINIYAKSSYRTSYTGS